MTRFLCKTALFCVLTLCIAVPALAAGKPVYLPSYPIQFLRDGKQIAQIQAEIALTMEEKKHGLMFRESLPKNSGMLFVYSHPVVAGMWMKNTFIPLDMLFIDANFRVVHIHENAIPHDLTPITVNLPVWAVLELNGGAAETLGITRGDRLRLTPEALQPRSHK